MHEKYNKKMPSESEMLFLARTVAKQAVDISIALPEVLQWRVGSAFQGDVYDMLSSVAAAEASDDEYMIKDELANARIKASVIKNGLSLVSKDSEELLIAKIDKLLDHIDSEYRCVKIEIQSLEDSEDT